VLAAILALSAAPALALDLLGAYHEALNSDSVYAAAEALERAEHKEIAKAAAGFLPAVSFSGTATRNDTHNTARLAPGVEQRTHSAYLSESYNVSLRQPLFRKQSWDQFWEARAVASRAREALRGEGQSLALRVAGFYFEALYAQAQLQAETAHKKTLEETLTLAEKALSAGAGTVTDVYEVRARRDLAAASELEAQNALENAVANLRVLIDHDPGPLSDLDPRKLPTAALEPVETWIERGEAANPNLQTLRWEIETARGEMGKARAGHFPSLDFIASWRRADNELETSLNREYYSYLAGLQMTVPIWSSGFVHASVVQASERVTRARARYEAGRKEIGLNVRKEHGNARLHAARVAALTQAVASVEQALGATQKGVTAGTRTTIDVLNAQDLVFKTRVDLAKAAYFYAMSTLRLNEAAGSLGESAIHDVNGWLAAAP
jgi:TolC family type I secretion outer membrane protein